MIIMMIMKKQSIIKPWLIVLIIITGFLFIVSFASIYVSDAIKYNTACGCNIPIPLMILILSSLGLFVGSLCYYILTYKYYKEENTSNNVQKRVLEIILMMLEPEEKEVIKELIRSNNEPITQSLIVKKTGLSRVKVHRITKKLVNKGLITVNNKNKLLLSPQLQGLLTF